MKIMIFHFGWSFRGEKSFFDGKLAQIPLVVYYKGGGLSSLLIDFCFHVMALILKIKSMWPDKTTLKDCQDGSFWSVKPSMELCVKMWVGPAYDSNGQTEVNTWKLPLIDYLNKKVLFRDYSLINGNQVVE